MRIDQDAMLLAPMAGVTDASFRALCTRMGADGTITEMISAKGVVLCPKERQEVALLRAVTAGERAAVQLFGSDPDCMAEAARRFCGGPYTAVDVNMGCPAPKIVSGGDGSALLKDLRKAEKVVRAVVRASTLPVTVKLRLGWDETQVCYLEAGRMLEQCGVAAITLHARTRSQMYAGHADWDAIGQLVRQVSVPVIGNGDVASCADARRMLSYTGCRAVMVGRGAMGNPFLFRDWQTLRQGGTPAPVSPRERVQTALAQAQDMTLRKGEPVAAREMRKHFAWYVKGLPGSAQARQRINQAQTLGQLTCYMEEYLELLESGPLRHTSAEGVFP